MKGIFSQEVLLKFKRSQFYGLLVIYRWLALLPPLFTLPAILGQELLLALYGLAVANALLQTAFYFKLRPVLRKDFVYEPRIEQSGKGQLVLVGIDLLVCTLLNSIQDTPYYLYSLAPLFYSALLAGPTGALTAALILGAAYLAARISALVVGGESINWLATVTWLTSFFLVAFLAGFLIAVAEQLRKYAAIIARYRGNLERQNQSLERTNQQLEYVGDFSRVLQQGTTPAQVEALALDYLARLMAKRRAGPGREQSAQLLKESGVDNWLQGVEGPTPFNIASGNAGVIRVTRQGQVYWLVALIYQGDRFGVLALPNASYYPEVQAEFELEEKLLIALLADRLAYVLGSLKQSQALAVEAERTRLAMDMHDVVAQSLFGIAYNLDGCIKLLSRDHAAAQQRLGDLRTLAFDTLSSVRSIIYDLSNEDAETDFAIFLQSYLKKAGRLYPFKIYLDIRVAPPAPASAFRLSRDSQKSLYRLVQEALSNAAKHSGASEVHIVLSRGTGGVRLEIHDNGNGFSIPNGREQPGLKSNSATSQLVLGGMGLENMRERVKQSGGNLLIDSAPGKGTHLIADVPIAA